MNRPDIILVVLDTQRADRLGCYGRQPAITPNLDQFARRGVLFEQAVSPAQWTIPSHASLFTGLYPTAHQVTQSAHSISPELPHLAELLRDSDYQTAGFCNNPLVGILNNGFKRGFQTFYNYGGAFPSTPHHSSSLPWPLNRATAAYTQFLRRISYPIQNFFGQSDLAFRVSLNAWLTPLWSRFANFKGQNARSARDAAHFLRRRENEGDERPLFLFLNLMETHLPFWPPDEFIDRVSPNLRQNKEATAVMRRWNREAYRWAAPLAEPLSELEDQVLNDLYDAEVAYQDDYLGELLDVLDGRTRQADTLTVILSDHGDGLGDHGYMGHAFVAYEELVHVPLLMQWPRRFARPQRVKIPVSTRRVYHTLLDAAGALPQRANLSPTEIHRLTLAHTVHGRDPEQGMAYSEIYPPLNFVRAIENHQPDLLAPFRCRSLRRAIVKTQPDATTLKLIQVDDQPDELFDLQNDPWEQTNVLAARPSPAQQLNQQLNQMAANGRLKQQTIKTGEQVELDDALARQLRGLGYLD